MQKIPKINQLFKTLSFTTNFPASKHIESLALFQVCPIQSLLPPLGGGLHVYMYLNRLHVVVYDQVDSSL